jgi:hypothetical protein
MDKFETQNPKFETNLNAQNINDINNQLPIRFFGVVVLVIRKFKF